MLNLMLMFCFCPLCYMCISFFPTTAQRQNQGRRRSNNDYTSARQRQSTDVSVAPLLPKVFNCLIRLCNAMLEACQSGKDYAAAYRLLTHTTGFCTLILPDKDDPHQHSEVIYMTKRICMHPIFTDLLLWERVLLIHKKDRQRDKSTGSNTSNQSTTSAENNNRNQTNNAVASDSDESDDYEAAVSTLYEMLGYGMPSDNLAKFASRISQEKFLSIEREQKLLMLARRLVLKCDDVTDAERDLNLLSPSMDSKDEHNANAATMPSTIEGDTTTFMAEEKTEWEELVWFHPMIIESSNTKNQLSPTAEDGSTNAAQQLMENSCRKAPITNLIAFGSSVFATGAIDGSIFVAHTSKYKDKENDSSTTEGSQNIRTKTTVKGLRLDWGGRHTVPSSGVDDGYFGVGAVSCLAASKGPDHHFQSGDSTLTDNEMLLSRNSGHHIVAGTTNGDLRVWSLKDVLAAHIAKSCDPNDTSSTASSDEVLGTRRIVDILRGKPLGGHRGGVTCLDIPSHIYRPDCVVSGGADGLIKLWSVRNTIGKGGRSNTRSLSLSSARMRFAGGRDNGHTPSHRRKNSGFEPQDVLSGHGGKVLCLETAWHGDRLLSGGADMTLKLWDLASSGGKCFQTMMGQKG